MGGGEVGLSELGYDIITLLQSKLEALDIYDQFIADADEAGDTQSRQLFERLKQQDAQHVELLSAALERLVRTGKFR
jgi:bacterioferritin (cytochrome b1)